MRLNNQPLVAVWMLAYNHENYIGRAIEGIITQKTDYSFKLFIGEDKSTDNTKEICKSYAEKHPHQIELLLNQENDIVTNAKNTYNACFRSGARYMAMCEGDDYWTEPNKLQKQVSFLEKHTDYSLAFHNVTIHYIESDKNEPYYKTNEAIESQIKGKKKRIFSVIPTCSIVFRTEMLDPFPDWFWNIFCGDLFLFASLADRGKFKYFPETMAVYNRHERGYTSTFNRIKRKKDREFFYNKMNEYFNYRFAPQVKQKKLLIYGDLSLTYQNRNEIKTATDYMLKSLLQINSWQGVKIFLKDYWLSYFKGLF